MAKKSFKSGMDGLLVNTTVSKRKADKKLEPKRGRPKTNFKEVTKTSQVGTKENETRATFIINEDQLESIKAIAYWDRKTIREILSQALEAYLTTKKKDLNMAKDSYKKRTV